MIITWLSGLLLLIELNPSPSPLLLLPFFLPLSQALLVISFKSYFLYDLFLFPWLYFSRFHFLLSEFNAFLLHASSLLFSFLSFFSLCRLFFLFLHLFLALLHHVLVSFSSLSFSVSKDFFPPLFFIYMRSLSLSFCVSFCPPPHPISPLLALSLLEHCDTVVMVTPIIFWHEWRILY